jgi:hypothetical protein
MTDSPKFIPVEDAKSKVLYKYYPPERRDIFENWSVRFSPVHFNDTFDSDYIIYQPSDAPMRNVYHSTSGILCLTEDPDNQLMWVHYAKQAQGLLLDFIRRTDCFQTPPAADAPAPSHCSAFTMMVLAPST